MPKQMAERQRRLPDQYSGVLALPRNLDGWSRADPNRYINADANRDRFAYARPEQHTDCNCDLEARAVHVGGRGHLRF